MDELDQDELLMSLANLNQDDPYGRVWSTFSGTITTYTDTEIICLLFYHFKVFGLSPMVAPTPSADKQPDNVYY